MTLPAHESDAHRDTRRIVVNCEVCRRVRWAWGTCDHGLVPLVPAADVPREGGPGVVTVTGPKKKREGGK